MSEVERAAAVRRPRALTSAELAWGALIPCALVAAAAILLLGPPLGHRLFAPRGDTLWPPGWWVAQGAPEPVKHGRVAIAIVAPALLVAVVLAGARRPLRLPPRAARALAWTGQLALLALVALAVLGQRNVIHSYRPLEPVFSVAMLAIAAAATAAVVALMRAERVRELAARAFAERPLARVAGFAVAALLAATWLLESVETDRLAEEIGLMNWTLNDVFAVLNGHDPLVDYHLIYAKLLPYPTALVLLAFGTTGFVFTLFMAVLSLLALVAVYAILRRLAGSSLLGLLLFVPFLAVSDVRHTMIEAGMWPMRYGGAYLVAWLTVRQLDGRRPRHAWILFFVAGLLAVNDLEFGAAALLASVAALLCARPPRAGDLSDVRRLAGAVAGGVGAALACVCALTLVRAGTLPKPGLLLEWPHVFTNLGWFALPMPAVGLHLAIYATFAGALAVAAVRLVGGAEDRLLTGMLAWSGVFGLLAASYYAGRSDDVKLASMFSAWAFAISLLAIVCVRALSARRWRAPTIPELLVLFAVALSACMVSQLVSPRFLLRRLADSRSLPPPQYRPAAEQFVGRYVPRGGKTVIMLPEGFRIAYELGVDNVAPYESEDAVVTRKQLQTVIDTIRREHVTEVFVPAPGVRLLTEVETAPQQIQRILAAGFVVGDTSNGMVELHRRD